MSGHVKISGAWKTVAGVSTRVGGAWKIVQSGYTKIGGAWKQWYANVTDQHLIIGTNASPWLVGYPFTASGFGTRYSQPATIPNNGNGGVSLNPLATIVSVSGYDGGSPLSSYPLTVSGFGTRFADPSTNAPWQLANAQSNTAVAIGNDASPYVHAYPISLSGYGAKYSNPATAVPNIVYSLAFNPAGTILLVGYRTNAPYLTAYAFSAAGFGAKYADPASVAGQVEGVTFNATETAVLNSSEVSPFVHAFAWSASGFGTKYANPATLPAGYSRRVAFNPAGNAASVGQGSFGFASTYAFASGFGAKFANPASPPTTSFGVGFSRTGNAFALGSQDTPYVHAYSWSGSGYGTKYSNPASLPTARVFDTVFG